MAIPHFGGVILSLVGGMGMKNHWYIPYDFYGVFYFLIFYLAGWFCHYVKPIHIELFKRLFLPCFIGVVGYCLCKEQLENWIIIKILVAFMGIALIVVVSHYLKKVDVLTEILRFVGTHTLSIYVWHVFLFKVTELLLSQFFGDIKMSEGWNGCYAPQAWYLVLVYSVVGVLIPICYVKLLNVIRKK